MVDEFVFECLTFELRRDRRYCAATLKSCTSHRRGAMPLGLASSEGLGLDLRHALRLTDWLTGGLGAFLSRLGVGCLDADGRRNCVHSCRRSAKKQVVRAACGPVLHARWFPRAALHCFLELSERLPRRLELFFSPLGAPRQIPRTPKDVSAAVVEGGSRSRAWLGLWDLPSNRSRSSGLCRRRARHVFCIAWLRQGFAGERDVFAIAFAAVTDHRRLAFEA